MARTQLSYKVSGLTTAHTQIARLAASCIVAAQTGWNTRNSPTSNCGDAVTTTISHAIPEMASSAT